jgi:hypothetical protein
LLLTLLVRLLGAAVNRSGAIVDGAACTWLAQAHGQLA